MFKDKKLLVTGGTGTIGNSICNYFNKNDCRDIYSTTTNRSKVKSNQDFIKFKELNLNLDGGHQWLTADWLINYNFGFIRRGMFGSFFINLPFEYQNIIYFHYVLLQQHHLCHHHEQINL